MSLKIFKRLKFFRQSKKSQPKALAIVVWVNTKTFEISVQFQFGQFKTYKQVQGNSNVNRVPVFEWYNETKDTSYFFNRNIETLELLKFLVSKQATKLEKHNPAVGKDLVLNRQNGFITIFFNKNGLGRFTISLSEQELEELKLILQSILPEIQKIHLHKLFEKQSQKNTTKRFDKQQQGKQTRKQKPNNNVDQNETLEADLDLPNVESDSTVVEDDWNELEEFFST